MNCVVTTRQFAGGGRTAVWSTYPSLLFVVKFLMLKFAFVSRIKVVWKSGRKLESSGRRHVTWLEVDAVAVAMRLRSYSYTCKSQ